jgi:glycosyltransferase involved in cell wall biosynthesis
MKGIPPLLAPVSTRRCASPAEPSRACRIRVALVSYAMYTGGMEALLLRLGRYLRDHGCDVELITTVEPGQWFGRASEFNLKASHVAGYRGPGLLKAICHSLRVGSQLARGRHHVILLNHTRHAQASIGRLPDPVVVIPILHNDQSDIYDVGLANQEGWNAVVAVSPKVAATARERVPNRPVLHIPSGVDLPQENLWQRRRGAGTPLELIFVGRLEHTQKGVLWLPDIFRTCIDRGVDANLTIVGEGPDSAEVLARFRDSGLQRRIRHLQGLTPEQVYTLLLDAHVLLMPSRYEGLPIALLESLACGCVPVASRLPGVTDAAVQHGETGILVSVGDVIGYAEAVATLHNDPALWSRLSRAAHARASTTFSTETMGRSYLELISEALRGAYPIPRCRKYQMPVDLSAFTWRDLVPDRFRQLGRRGLTWLSRAASA